MIETETRESWDENNDFNEGIDLNDIKYKSLYNVYHNIN
jgi:hypothetical protein